MIAAAVGAFVFDERLGIIGVLGAALIVASGAWVALEPAARVRMSTPP